MKASAARDIVLAHAMETSSANDALPDARRCAAITQECLHALGDVPTEGAAGRKGFEKFLQLRAGRIIAAGQLPPAVRQVWQQSAAWSRLTVLCLAIAALALGFAGHAVTDPHRVDLLSPALLAIVLWNLLVYVLLVVAGARGLIQRRASAAPMLEPTDANRAANAGEAEEGAQPGWLRKLGAGGMSRGLGGGGLRKLALNFERNWQRINARSRRAQWLGCMHLGAALLALGALASLWSTGLWRAYQVGWESTFLAAQDVQRLLNLLFAPVQWLPGHAAWSLADIEALQGWMDAGGSADAGTAMGRGWVQAYSVLLALVVIAPRLLLALWQWGRARWLAGHLALPLQQAYFQSLQRDYGGAATSLAVLAYSLELTPERQAALQRHAGSVYGAGVHLHWQPPVEYGSELPLRLQPADAQPVLLLNLAATPEPELHGAVLSQLRARWGEHTPVWLWTTDFAARNTAAPERVRERRALWQGFVQSAGLTAHWVEEEQ